MNVIVYRVFCRCDGHHLCGGQQQLQHGDQRRQSDQQAAGGPQPLQEHLEQQVSGQRPSTPMQCKNVNV